MEDNDTTAKQLPANRRNMPKGILVKPHTQRRTSTRHKSLRFSDTVHFENGESGGSEKKESFDNNLAHKKSNDEEEFKVRHFLRAKLGPKWQHRRKNKYEDFSHIVNQRTVMRDTLTQQEKDEQKRAERLLKKRLRAKFGVKDTTQDAAGERNLPSQDRSKASVVVYEEDINDDTYDEADPNVFDGSDLRVGLGYLQVTEQMHDTIIDCLRSEEEKVVNMFNIQITKRDLYCLTGENWLNDKVLEFYLQMVAQRSQQAEFRAVGFPTVHCMSTYFFLDLIIHGPKGSIQHWNRDVDIFAFDLVLVPVHLQEHWCLAIIDFRTKALLYYDPMGGDNMPALSAILGFIRQEHHYKKGRALDLWPFAKEMKKDWPQQENTADCGMFVAKVAEFFARDAAISFGQADMPYFRKRLLWEVINTHLISP
jgi:hypothetical protein